MGYPGTMGSQHLDYVLADAVTIPPENERFFSERVCGCGLFSSPPIRSPRGQAPPTRAESGLPETGFVFCGFNKRLQAVAGMFDIWMRSCRRRTAASCAHVMNETGGPTAQRGAAARRAARASHLWPSVRRCVGAHFARLRFAESPSGLRALQCPLDRHPICFWPACRSSPAGSEFSPRRVAASMLTSMEWKN